VRLERLRRNPRCFADDDALAARDEPQADSSERPFWRRAAKMARPARVRMRRRKPWVLALRRLFGWNVRLLTRILRYCTAIRCSVLKVVRGTRSNDAVAGLPDETAAGIRKRPSTQAWSHGTGVNRARSNSSGWPGHGPRTTGKPPMVNPCGRPCQDDTPGNKDFLRIDDEFSGLNRVDLTQASVLRAVSALLALLYTICG
jgi:hypothetical protein